jgi:hypothetical protein
MGICTVGNERFSKAQKELQKNIFYMGCMYLKNIGHPITAGLDLAKSTRSGSTKTRITRGF